MNETNILCPDCFKGKLIKEESNENEAYCNKCNIKFIIVSKNTVKYK